MVAYSFKERFITPIRVGLGLIGMGTHNGVEVPCEFVIDDATGKLAPFDPLTDLDPPVHPKRQTIRSVGKRRHARPGETLQLYYAMRTKACRKIGEARCTSVAGIRIWINEGRVSVDDYPALREADDLDIFAQADGFGDWADMREFWKGEHGDLKRLGPWTGVLIKWEPINEPSS